MKKFWDIVPPENYKNSNEELKKEKEKKRKNKKISWGFNWGFFFFFILVGGGLFVTLKMSRSEIKIWPKTQVFNLGSSFKVDTSKLDIDYENNIIPGKVFEEEKVISEEFPATGSVERKAEGVIRLYNAYTTMSETWLQGTRFVSEDGKFFKSKEKIVVPGASIENSKIVPSYVDVPVIAAEGGEEYNIEPSSFSIYVYRGTERYTKFYGESFESMSGGGEFSKITSKDLESAEDVLIEKSQRETKNFLKNKIEGDYIVLDNAFKTSILDSYTSHQEGEILDSFAFTVQGKAKTISFDPEKGKEFVVSFVNSQIPNNYSIYENSLNTSYEVESIDWENEEVMINFSVEVQTYPKIDFEFLKNELGGKSVSETEFLLENQTEISNVEVNFWPFWINTIPQEDNRIEIEYPIID